MLNKSLLIKFVLVIVLVTAFIGPITATAAVTGNFVTESSTQKSNPIKFTPQVGLPGFEKGTGYTFSQTASTLPIALLAKSIYNYGIKIIGLLALLTIIIGGFLWSIAGGNGSKVGEAKQWIFSGLIGLALAIFSYTILRTININLVSFQSREIPTVAGLNLVNTGKSNQKQVTEDYGFFDHYYSFPPIGDNPTKEACCISYNRNSFSLDKSHFASMLYAVGEESAVERKCKNFTFNLFKTGTFGSGVTKEDHVAKLRLKEGQAMYWNKNWDNDMYANAYEGGKCTNVCSGVLYDFACWDAKAGNYINKGAEGKNKNTYCQGKEDGTSCIGQNNKNEKIWGYCQDNNCQTCSTYGKTCTANYQCPDQKKAIGKSTWVKSWQCGKDVDLNNDCASGKCDCEAAECKTEYNANK